MRDTAEVVVSIAAKTRVLSSQSERHEYLICQSLTKSRMQKKTWVSI
jgi:hypothetical protein